MDSDKIIPIGLGKVIRHKEKLDNITSENRSKVSGILRCLGLTEEVVEFCLDHTEIEDWLGFLNQVTANAETLGKKITYEEPPEDLENLEMLIGYYRENLNTMSQEDAALQAIFKPWKDQGFDDAFFEQNMFSYTQLALVSIEKAKE